MSSELDDELVPPPPEHDLLRSHLLLEVVPPREQWRIHSSAFSPGSFNATQHDPPGGGRYDHGPGPPGAPAPWGHLYGADHVQGAVCESLLRLVAVVPAPTPRVLLRAQLVERDISRLVPTRPLTLAVLRDAGLVALGVDTAISSAPPRYYGYTRAWARAIHDAVPECDGISYRSRHDATQTCVVLFGDRVTEDELRVAEGPHPLRNGSGWNLITDALEPYGITPPLPF